MRTPLTVSILLTACTVPAQQPDPSAERVLCDFAEPDEGGRWRTVLDGVMGGRSTGSFEVRDGSMVFTGVLNTNGGGFSSVRRPGEDLQLGQDGEVGVRLRVRADGSVAERAACFFRLDVVCCGRWPSDAARGND